MHKLYILGILLHVQHHCETNIQSDLTCREGLYFGIIFWLVLTSFLPNVKKTGSAKFCTVWLGVDTDMTTLPTDELVLFGGNKLLLRNTAKTTDGEVELNSGGRVTVLMAASLLVLISFVLLIFSMSRVRLGVKDMLPCGSCCI